MLRAGVKCDRRAAGNTLRGTGGCVCRRYSAGQTDKKTPEPGRRGRRKGSQRQRAGHAHFSAQMRTDTDIHVKHTERPLGSQPVWYQPLSAGAKWLRCSHTSAPSSQTSAHNITLLVSTSTTKLSFWVKVKATALMMRVNMPAPNICWGQNLVYLQLRSEASIRPGQTHCSIFSTSPY